MESNPIKNAGTISNKPAPPKKNAPASPEKNTEILVLINNENEVIPLFV